MTRRPATFVYFPPPSEPWLTVCDGCREWVDGIYAITQDHRRLCITCDAKRGDPTAIKTLTRQGRWDPATGKPCTPPAPPPPPPPTSHAPQATRPYSMMSLLDDL